MIRVLLAEDDPDMLKIVQLYFQKEGFYVSTYLNGKAALEALLEEKYDLAVLDWMMPKLDGLEVCKQIKALGLSTKTIMLTAKSEINDEIIGLREGADDYITKPFEPQILILRAKKLLNIENKLQHKSLTLNVGTQKAYYSDRELGLSNKEYQLLEYFMRNIGVVLSRNQLIDHVWGFDYEGDSRTVDTHIKRLRSKIGTELITTHHGFGYCMEKNNE